MKRNKCDYNYFKNQIKSEIIKTCALFGSSIIILIIGMVITGYRNPDMPLIDTKNNILTIAAVLGLLPASRYLVNVIMFFKARKHSCDEESYNKILSATKDSELNVRYDMYITSYDNNFSILSMVVADGCIIGLTDDKSFKDDKFAEHIKGLAKKNGLNVNTIKIFNSCDKYVGRLETLKTNGYKAGTGDIELSHLMENLSL